MSLGPESVIRRTESAAELARKIAALKQPDGDPWIPSVAGLRMRPVTQRDIEDDALVEDLGRWRAAYMSSYPTQFTVTPERTRAWLRDVIVGNPGRLMLLLVDADDVVVGHLGFDRADVGGGGLQLSNVVVGRPERMGRVPMSRHLGVMLDWAREALRPNDVWAPVFPDNVRPIRMMRNVGFVDGERRPLRLHVTGDRHEYLPREPGDDAPPDQWHMWVHWPVEPVPPFTGVGLGTAPTAHADPSPATQTTLAATIDRALERGVRWIDTAGIYGLGAVEQTIGAALTGPDRPAVATKCGLVWDGGRGRAVAVGDVRTLREQAERSRERLGTDRLDLLFLHRPPEDGTDLEAAWSALAELADAGVAERIGLAGGDLGALERCHALRPVDAIQAPVSLVRPNAAVVAGAHALGVPVMAYGALETGLLAGRGPGEDPDPRDRRRRSPLFADPQGRATLLDVLERVVPTIPCTIPELAAAWVLDVPGVTGTVIGARRPEQVDGWSSAAGVRLPPGQQAEISAAIARLGAAR